MLERLNALLGADRRSWARMIGISSLTVAAWGLIAESGNNPIQQAQIEATLLGIAVFAAQILVYCLPVRGSAIRLEGRRRAIAVPFQLAAATGLLILLSGVASPILQAAILHRRLRQLSQRPLSQHDTREIVSLFEAAKNTTTKLDPRSVSVVEMELKTVASSQEERASDAWEGLLSLAAYRTSQNPMPDLQTLPASVEPTLTYVAGAGSPEGLREYRYGSVPATEAARYAPIGNEMNPGATSGSQYIVVEHQWPIRNLRLDSMHIRNTAFRNATIEYSGGSVILEQVYFVNCTFQMAFTLPSSQLVEAILSRSPISFRHGA